MFDWREYNERLVRRGEILMDFSFLERWEEELAEMNRGKRGRKFTYTDSLFVFLGYLYVFVRSYRMVEGICRAFQKLVPHFPAPDYSVQRRLHPGQIFS